MNIWKALADVPRIIADVPKIVGDAQQLISDVATIESNEEINTALANDPVLAAAVGRISAEIRSLENDINDAKNVVADLLH